MERLTRLILQNQAHDTVLSAVAEERGITKRLVCILWSHQQMWLVATRWCWYGLQVSDVSKNQPEHTFNLSTVQHTINTIYKKVYIL